jgi:hypothetical protein
MMRAALVATPTPVNDSLAHPADVLAQPDPAHQHSGSVMIQ